MWLIYDTQFLFSIWFPYHQTMKFFKTLLFIFWIMTGAAAMAHPESTDMIQENECKLDSKGDKCDFYSIVVSKLTTKGGKTHCGDTSQKLRYGRKLDSPNAHPEAPCEPAL
jgi:tyrosine-protein phosphatase YwqE